MKKTTLSLCAGAVLLAGCQWTQEPVAVIDGYQLHQNKQAYDRNREVQVERISWNQPQISEEAVQETATSPVVTYTVKEGDTLHIVSRKLKVPVQKLMDANGLPNENFLLIGQQLVVPGDEPVGTIAPQRQKRYSLTRSRFEKREQQVATAKASAPQPEPATRLVETHQVASGENLYRIGMKYGVTPIDLMMYNNIDKPEDLQLGQTLKIPSKYRPGNQRITSPNRGYKEPDFTELAKIEPAAGPTSHVKKTLQNTKRRGMVWPAHGRVIKSFGDKGEGVSHMGINIELPENSPIVAADAGEVIYADDGLQSYGNLVLVRHSSGMVTAYAHNSRNIVSKNEKVEKGQVIAYAGSTGNVETPQLHFEVRKNAQAIDPKKVLP